jgi:hypothetical protein
MAIEDRYEQRVGRMDDDVEERAAHLVPKMVGNLKRADERIVALVQERPVAVLCTAVAVGYLVGRVLSSRG